MDRCNQLMDAVSRVVHQQREHQARAQHEDVRIGALRRQVQIARGIGVDVECGIQHVAHAVTGLVGDLRDRPSGLDLEEIVAAQLSARVDVPRRVHVHADRRIIEIALPVSTEVDQRLDRVVETDLQQRVTPGARDVDVPVGICRGAARVVEVMPLMVAEDVGDLRHGLGPGGTRRR